MNKVFTRPKFDLDLEEVKEYLVYTIVDNVIAQLSL